MASNADKGGGDKKHLPGEDTLKAGPGEVSPAPGDLPDHQATEPGAPDLTPDPGTPDLEKPEPAPAAEFHLPPDAPDTLAGGSLPDEEVPAVPDPLAAADSSDPLVDTEADPTPSAPLWDEGRETADTLHAAAEGRRDEAVEPSSPILDPEEGTPSRVDDRVDDRIDDRIDERPKDWSAAPAEPVAAAPAASPAPEVAEEIEDHEHEGSSLAAKLLGLLLLLLAGAALGIWAAPRVAPMLPSGMAPVAEWLAPGSDAADAASARVAEVQAAVDERLAALEGRLDGLATRDEVTGGIEAAKSDIDGDIARLRDAVTAADPSSLGQRLSQIEGAVDGQRGELDTLKQQIESGVSTAGEEAAGRIDVYRAELDGLRAEVDRLSGELGGLSGRLDEVAASAEARVKEIEATAGARASAAEVEADVAGIRAALAAGRPFADEAERLQASGAVELPADLAAAAGTGAPSLSELEASFPAAAHEAIRASILAGAGGGFLERARAYAEAQLASRSLTPQPGDSADAVLSRMEAKLGEGDLGAMLTESEALPGEAKAAMSDWLAGARARQAADAALDQLGSTLPSAN